MKKRILILLAALVTLAMLSLTASAITPVNGTNGGIIVFDGFVTSGYSGRNDDDSDNLPDNHNQGDIFMPLEYLSLLTKTSARKWKRTSSIT